MIERLPDEVRALLRPEAVPDWRAPMLATLTDKRFSDPRWIFELKLDGQRCLAFRDGDRIQLLSRNRQPLNDTYPELVDALAAQRTSRFVVDGEVVAFQGEHTSFQRLQGRLGITNPAQARASRIPVSYCLFDLLHLEGYSTTRLPLIWRKRLLHDAVRCDDPLRYTTHRWTDGQAAYREACEHGDEGVIAKLADSRYEEGRRSPNWLKFKCTLDQEFVIGGPGGSSSRSSLSRHWRVRCGYADEVSRKLSIVPSTASLMQPSRVGDHASIRRSAVCGTLRCPDALCAMTFRPALRIGGRSQPAQMVNEPVAGQHRHLREGARLLEEMSGRGITTISHVPRITAPARRFRSRTISSYPPTIEQRGRVHFGQRLTRQVGPPAAGHHRCHLHPRIGGRDHAAPAPVLAPKKPTGSDAVSGWLASQPVTSTSRPANNSMSKTLARSRSSAGVSRSNSRVASPALFNTSATYRLRGLCLLLPLPCANTTIPVACSGW